MFLGHFHIGAGHAELDLIERIIRHFSALPYENISKIIKLNLLYDDASKIRLPGEVMEDHLSDNLGGTCFSLTFLLESILRRCGFTCFPVMADMRAGKNIHCCLVSELEGEKYLIDPGYLVTRPMPIRGREPQIVHMEVTGVELQFSKTDGRYHLFTFNHEKRTWRYRFLLKPVSHREFLNHWYRSFTLPGMHGIALSAVRNDRMIYIRKNYMRESYFQGKQNYNIRKDYHRVIGALFGIPGVLLEQAGSALKENLSMERKRGIFSSRREQSRP